MKKSLIWMFLLLLIPTASCMPARTPLPTPQAPPNLTGDWSVKMTQSGGIMGLLRTLEVQSNGKLHIEDLRNKQSTERQLNADQMKQLNRLVSSARLNAPREPEGVCADCFVYDIQITSNGRTFSTRLNDASLPDSGMQALVSYLIELTDLP